MMPAEKLLSGVSVGSRPPCLMSSGHRVHVMYERTKSVASVMVMLSKRSGKSAGKNGHLHRKWYLGTPSRDAKNGWCGIAFSISGVGVSVFCR